MKYIFLGTIGTVSAVFMAGMIGVMTDPHKKMGERFWLTVISVFGILGFSGMCWLGEQF